MCVAIRSRKYLSWDTTMAHPAKLRRASSKDLRVSTSRSFVGSSRIMRLAPDLRSFASWTRLRSPPLRLATFCCCWALLKPNQDTYALLLTKLPPSSISSRPPETSSCTVFVGSSSSILSCPTPIIDTVSPTWIVPASGSSFPMSILISVLLPAPFGPITPTIPALGKLNSKPSISRRSPNAFRTPFTSMTTSPNLGPGGM
mmetsp:Transcript_20759/g.44490  ORF Transcript_20759/g.44490 Transcript_20759/m.44490 type:complete len:201 (-) Transcript_20759:168-770(-)